METGVGADGTAGVATAFIRRLARGSEGGSATTGTAGWAFMRRLTRGSGGGGLGGGFGGDDKVSQLSEARE
jgi:hypothetical protein